MKNIISCVCLFSSLCGFSQTEIPKDTTWKSSGFIGLTASQTNLNNWQGGGDNNITLNSIFNYEIIYRRDAFENWINKIDAQFGLLRQGDSKLYRKSTDQLFALSKYSTKAFGKHWFYSAQADYRTQFAPGYKYSGDSVAGPAVSDFNSPGYVQLALGFDYQPRDYFSITISPLAGKITFVNRQYLADEGAFGVKPAERDTNGRILKQGEKVRYEFGGRVIVRFKKDLNKMLHWDSYLDLFSNYLEKPQNVDVIFNNLVTYKINRIFTATFICQMLYDNDVVIKRDWNKDGKFDGPNDIYGPRLQVLTTLGIGLGYKF